jgi:hypothetical protein
LSPILVRPVREQLEHDRVIRLLQQDLQKRKVEVGINPGSEQNASVGSGNRKEYPDAVVYSLEKGKKVVAVVEVETGESVNHLEAMAQWAHLAKLRVPFHLYVPINSVDVARRLSHDYKINVTEIWSYHQVGEQFKFTLFHPVSGSRGGRASTPPRTVSVASIRVALPVEPEPVVEEPVVKAEPALPARSAVKAQGLKTIPARVATPAVPAVKPVAKASAAPVPRVIPVKATPPAVKPPSIKPAPVAATKPASATAPKGAASKVAPPRGPASRPATKAVIKPAPKAAAKPVPKPTARTTGRAAAGKSKSTTQAANGRPAARTVKSTAKPAARQVAKAVAKPAAKRK